MIYLQYGIIFSQVIIVAYSGQLLQSKLFNTQVIQITRMDGQCRNKNLPMQITFNGIKSDSKLIFITHSTATVKKDLVDNLKLTITMIRCQSRENLDSCEEFYKMENLDHCKSVNPDSLLTKLSPFVLPFTPKLKCPFKKGVYHANNFTLNLTPVMLPNMDGWYWKVIAESFSPVDHSLILCLTFEANVYSKSLA